MNQVYVKSIIIINTSDRNQIINYDYFSNQKRRNEKVKAITPFFFFVTLFFYRQELQMG
jgi:hypothetical protein